jgi:hypothetical protein
MNNRTKLIESAIVNIIASYGGEVSCPTVKSELALKNEFITRSALLARLKRMVAQNILCKPKRGLFSVQKLEKDEPLSLGDFTNTFSKIFLETLSQAACNQQNSSEHEISFSKHIRQTACNWWHEGEFKKDEKNYYFLLYQCNGIPIQINWNRSPIDIRRYIPTVYLTAEAEGRRNRNLFAVSTLIEEQYWRDYGCRK